MTNPPEIPNGSNDSNNSNSASNQSAATASSTTDDSDYANISDSPRERQSLKPIGIVNESNTCFLNSTFQALSATAPLASLLTSSPQSPIQPLSTGSLPAPIVAPGRIPSLQPESTEPPLYSLLPVTRAFTTALNRSWKLKDAGGGTFGAGETAAGRSMSLRSLLREISRKYDQYDDYQQQDAHELLRHLLDSMEMEEKDVVKKLQPLPPSSEKKRRKGRTNHLVNHNQISPLPSPMPSPAHSMPSSPIKQTFALPDPPSTLSLDQAARSTDSDLVESLAQSPITVNGYAASENHPVIPKDQRLIPFVDVLFGGSLASVVVCAKCKSVSHTYEGFLDISLSLKEDDPKPRKRDRLRAMAQRFKPKSSSKTSPEIPTSPSGISSAQLSVSVSDGELSESETPTDRTSRRRSLDQDDRTSDSTGASGLSRNNSKSFGGLRNKTSFSFRRKGQRSSSANSRTPPSPDLDKTPAVMPASPKTSLQPQHHPHHDHIHSAVPTPAQAAYIARILTPPQGMVDPMDPLTRLRQAHNGEQVQNVSVEYGLIDSLRAFTSVEVLEGENAFACRKCWKIKHGRYDKHEAPLKEEDEDGTLTTTTTHTLSMSSSFASDTSSPPTLASPRAAPPSISILGSPASGDSQLQLRSSPVPIQDGDRHLRGGRISSVASSSSRTSLARAPSPLRRQVEDESYVEQMSHATLESFPTISTTSMSISDADGNLDGESDSSDGLSDSDSSDDEAQTPGPGSFDVNNKKTKSKDKNHKRKSSHFVMGRAFKRYLIAEAPEIMVFHFKRFKQLYKTSMTFASFYNLKKIDDFMPFPEMLDLAPFLAPNRKDYKINQTPNGPHAKYMDWAHPDQGPELEPVNYRLYAVVVHLGTMIGGHYIAYCLVDPEQVFGTAKPSAEQVEDNVSGTAAASQVNELRDAEPARSPNGKKDKRVWCYCSDTSIRLATVSEVLAARAYLCFYEKVH